MPLDTPNGIRTYALTFADELASDVDGDFYDEVMDDFIPKRWRHVCIAHPWLELTVSPPGVLLTVDDITTLTLTITATGTSVAGTLSAAPGGSVSVSGRKIRPSGVNWIARITAHVGGETGITLDAVPATIAAGTACTIFGDEYDLATALGVFIDGIWTQDGSFVELWPEERIRSVYPFPPSAGWPPVAFSRLTDTRIRFSSYPTSIQRCEYPYTRLPADPTGSGTLVLPVHARPALAEFVLSDLLHAKKDKEWQATYLKAQKLLEDAITYDTRLRLGQGIQSHQVRPSPYGHARSGGRYSW
mgnify:FL=1